LPEKQKVKLQKKHSYLGKKIFLPKIENTKNSEKRKTKSLHRAEKEISNLKIGFERKFKSFLEITKIKEGGEIDEKEKNNNKDHKY
jgi:hypothetical protein